MRIRFWTVSLLLALILSGCGNPGGQPLVFFCDQDFCQVAEYAPAVFSDHEEPLFPELSAVAAESGFALKKVSINVSEENYLQSFQKKLPSTGSPLIITSFLYTLPEVQNLLDSYQVAVVGAALDIPLDNLSVAGGGFELLREEGRTLASLSKNLALISLANGFQRLIAQSFLDGAGDKEVFHLEIETNAQDIRQIDLFQLSRQDMVIVTSFGPYFKSVSSPKTRTGTIHVVNYPSAPDFSDPYMRKRVESFICYDFATSFKSAILELSDKGEKKSFYAFDLVRR